MEVLFQNKHIRDKEWAKDINRYIYFKRPILIVIYILCVLYVFSSVNIFSICSNHFCCWVLYSLSVLLTIIKSFYIRFRFL